MYTFIFILLHPLDRTFHLFQDPDSSSWLSPDIFRFLRTRTILPLLGSVLFAACERRRCSIDFWLFLLVVSTQRGYPIGCFSCSLFAKLHVDQYFALRLCRSMFPKAKGIRLLLDSARRRSKDRTVIRPDVVLVHCFQNRTLLDLMQLFACGPHCRAVHHLFRPVRYLYRV